MPTARLRPQDGPPNVQTTLPTAESFSSPVPPPESGPPSGPLEPEPSSGLLATEGQWRDQIARRMLVVTLPFVVLGAGMAFATVSAVGRLATGTACVIAVLLMASDLVRPWLSTTARSWLIVGHFYVISVLSYATVGFIAGPALSMAASAVAAGLLLGPRALAAVLLAAAVGVGVVGWAMTTGHLPLPPAIDVALAQPRTWVRSGVVSLMFHGFIAVTTMKVVERIESLLGRTRAEVARRQRAERDRLETLSAAMKAQKLEAIGRLAAGAAHDFNNALMVIQFWNDLLASPTASAADRAEGTRAIAEATRQATALAGQLLVLGRRETRSPIRMALPAFVEGCRGTLRRLLPADTALEITVEAHEDGGPWALVDEVQMNQVLLNLALNARDAIGAGGRLAVRTRIAHLREPLAAADGQLEPGLWGVIEVEDDGAGMDEETQRRAFEPFFTTKPTGSGTGLGLATVIAIVRQSGGRVTLRSAPGRGTEVTLWLPAQQAPEPLAQAPAPRAPLTLRAAPATPLAGLTILFAEDNEMAARIVVHVLTSAGARLLIAKDGSEALERLEAHEGSIDLLCTDAVMPGAPLGALLRRFEERHAGAPVLICSGYVSEELARLGIEAGRYRFLAKPFTPDQLLAAVKELCKSAAASQAD